MQEMLVCTSSSYPEVCLKVSTTASSLGDTLVLHVAKCGYVANNLGNMSYEAAFCLKEYCVQVGGVGNYLLSNAASTFRNCGLTLVAQTVARSSYLNGAGVATGVILGAGAVTAALTLFGIRACRRRKAAEQTPLTSADTTNDLELAPPPTTPGFQSGGVQ